MTVEVPLDDRDIPKPEGNIKVLVVDDDPVTRSVVSRNLRALGYEPVAAAGGSEALELLNKEEFLLMLVDVMMPEMDGFSLIRFYRQAFQKEIPSIMMSGSEEPETVAKSFQCGAEDFLPKPIKPEILKARIQRCLDYRDIKTKEKNLLDQIDEESEKTRALKEQVAANERQLQEYKRKVNDTIETPLQIIISTVSDLLSGKYQASESKLALITIMKSLSGSDLYRPAFVDYMKRTDMDDTTREWLMNQYSRDAGDDPNAHKSEADKLQPVDTSSQPRQGRRPSSSVPFSMVSPASPNSTKELPFDLDSYQPCMVGDQNLFTIRYNAFDYSVDELKKHIMYMYKSLGFFSAYNINPLKLWNLLGVLKKKVCG